MVNVGGNIRWVRYPRHRKAKATSWNNGRAKKASVRGPSQYNPMLVGTDQAVKELETKCLRKGEKIHESQNKLKAYMKMDYVVGVCSGFETNYVFVEMTSSGEYHGRPISPEALKEMGVTNL